MTTGSTPAKVRLSAGLGPLRPLTDDERQLLHDNPNTDDVVDFVAMYAMEAVLAAVVAERERAAKLCERIASPYGLEWPGKPKTYFCDDGTGCAGAIRMDGL